MKNLRLMFTMLLLVIVNITFGQEKTFIESMFGEGIGMLDVGIFLLMGLTGLIFSIVIDIYSSGAELAELSWKRWWGDNKVRLVVSLMLLFITMVFSEQLLEINLSKWSMFLAGFTSDKLIENLVQRKRKQNK